MSAKTVVLGTESGQTVSGIIAEPAGHAKVGGVVVVQEWHGLNDYMKSVVQRFADAGWLAVAPDLYHGTVVATDAEAAQAMSALDMHRAVAEIGTAVKFLKTAPRSNGKVAVVGFCLGGGLAFAAVRHVDGLAAAVPFYGLPGFPPDALSKTRVPILAHFARRDDWAKLSVAEEIAKQIRAAGGQMELHAYEAGHAFMRHTDPKKHDAESSKLAWERTVRFLGQHLG